MRPYPALLLLLATTAAQAEQDCTAPVTQTDMNICAFQDYQRADARLNAAYKKRVATLDKAQLDRLRTAQRAWITFRDAQCRYEAGVYEGGSMAPLVHSSCLTKLTEQRTKDLISLEDQP
ncbi:lysozyme inhibitor LprI family protein [Aeromonas media]|uniref:lysozyme inhibitor LprI family protein n=1 Tax=Aeromonas media TaxID=651 RepID=UPI0029D67503|nr:lysozyme inhibitor LprI family protein [Aeromonas media]MDX7901349.1 lysozyme inhibitor LprI family protein [Aeromonas media]